jgi:transposase InsO family protein
MGYRRIADAWLRRRPLSGLIFPSDRGRQTAAGDVRMQRVTFGLKGSMNRTGDNAVIEALFGSFKVERLHELHFATRRRAKPFDRLTSGDRLAFVLQSPEAARDAGISRPDGLRGKTACR